MPSISFKKAYFGTENSVYRTEKTVCMQRSPNLPSKRLFWSKTQYEEVMVLVIGNDFDSNVHPPYLTDN